jgi:hypothetical protein
MKTVNIIVAAATVLLVVVLSSIQPRRANAPPAYNAAAETTISGVVAEAREFFCPVSEDQEVHLILRNRQDATLIHVAPSRFLRTQQFHINADDPISVVGTRINYQGQDAMLAREITHGNEVLILRNHQGRPLWIH